MQEIFQFRNAVSYQLRTLADFQIQSAHCVFSGTENIKLVGPKTWKILPLEIKQLVSLGSSKKQ